MTAARRTSVSSTGVEREGIGQGTLIGRTREIARLKAALDGLDGTPPAGRTVVIGGEAGIGKSRLVRSLLDAATAGGANTLTGACLPTGSGAIPYAPFVEAIRGLTRSVKAWADRRPARTGAGRDRSTAT